MTLEIAGLTKRFGPILALDGVSFRVEPGEVFGFLGANGAGKTTTMRIVLDILRPDAGTVTWQGRPTREAPRRTFGYLPEERGLYPRMGVLEQLVHFGVLYGVSRRDATTRARHWMERLRIGEYEKRRAEELSKGNQQKVQLIAAILHGPSLLLMDEPFVGLDPVNVSLLKSAFEEMRRDGATLVFSTHQMEMVEELCESVILIDRGRVVIGGTIAEVRRSTGRQVVRLGVRGDPTLAWLAELDGVTVTRSGRDYTEAQVAGSRDPETILTEAIARGEHISLFVVADPSIEQIFIEKVGRPPSEDHLLAGGAAGSAGAAGAAGAAGSTGPGGAVAA